MKTCTKCKKNKPLVDYYKRTTAHDGYYTWCKACELIERQYRRKAYPDTYKNEDLKKHYGITIQEYRDILEEQDGKCAICKTTKNTRKSKGVLVEESFCVDHCHSTGAVRGLLCYSCNLGLGKFKDNKTFLRQAIKYLDRAFAPEYN